MNAQRLFSSLCLSVLGLAAASPMFALANRVFVSARSGNDANSCDNILTPCQTFAGAVLQLNPGGDAIVLDTGGYGPVTITTSLTIEAAPGVTAFIHPPLGSAITVNAAGETVVLRGLTLDGSAAAGRGIDVIAVGALHVESCVINGFNGNGINVAAGSNIYVKDTISRQNGGTGISFVFNGQGSIDRCRFEGNGFEGVFVEGAAITVRDSVSAGNGFSGFKAFNAGSENTVLSVFECVSTNNGGDGFVGDKTGSGGVHAQLANSSISNNLGHGLDNISASFVSLGNNFVRGNTGGDVSGTITVVTGQ